MPDMNRIERAEKSPIFFEFPKIVMLLNLKFNELKCH